MPRDIEIRAIDRPPADFLEAVHHELRAHNRAASPLFWERLEGPGGDPLPLQLFALTRDGEEVLGGLLGSTHFAWLKIDLMATKAGHRNRGIGRALLAEAERIGRERGCRYTYVDTMSHQAPGFYRKTGFEEVGRIEDWDSHGHAKHFFRKDLSPD